MVPIPPTTDETELAGESQGQEVSGKREKGEVLFSWYNRGISRKQPGWKEGQGGSMQVGDPHQMNGGRPKIQEPPSSVHARRTQQLWRGLVEVGKGTNSLSVTGRGYHAQPVKRGVASSML